MKYKEWIMILLDKIDDEEVLKKIYNIVDRFFVKYT